MELRQLAYFLAIAEERNFTRAAQRIPIAQPAISQQIHRLESELSEKLFVRDRRGIRLTPAGEALLPHAQAMLANADHAREAVGWRWPRPRAAAARAAVAVRRDQLNHRGSKTPRGAGRQPAPRGSRFQRR